MTKVPRFEVSACTQLQLGQVIACHTSRGWTWKDTDDLGAEPMLNDHYEEDL